MISTAPIEEGFNLILTNNYAGMQDNNVNMQHNYVEMQEEYNVMVIRKKSHEISSTANTLLPIWELQLIYVDMWHSNLCQLSMQLFYVDLQHIHVDMYVR